MAGDSREEVEAEAHEVVPLNSLSFRNFIWQLGQLDSSLVMCIDIDTSNNTLINENLVLLVSLEFGDK